MSYGVFRPPPHLQVAQPRAHLPLATFTQKDTSALFSFPTPVSAPSGDEEFAVEVRRTGSGGTDPTVRLELWENGVFRATALVDTAVTSTTSQVVRGTWNVSSLTTADGSAVECYVYGTTSATGARVEIGAVEWNDTPTIGPTTVNLGALSLSGTLVNHLQSQNTYLHVGFPTPTSAPSGTEEFAVEVRRTGSGGLDPTVQILLYENGVYKATALGPTAVTSTTSQVVRGTWNASSLATADGSLVEAYIVGTALQSGNRVEIGAVEWNDTPAGGSPQTVNLGALTLTGSAPAPTVVPGAVSTNVAAQTLAASQPAATVVPGARTTNLAALTLAASQPTATVTPGTVTLNLGALSLLGTLPNATISSATNVNLGALTLASSAPAPTVTPGPRSTTLAALSAAASAPLPTVTPGPISTPVAALSAAGSLPVTTVVPGPASVNLAALTGTLSLPSVTVSGGTIVSLGALTLTASSPAPTVVPGAVTLTLLNAPPAAGSAATIAQLANRTIDEVMSDDMTLALTSTAPTVSAGTIVNLAALTLSGSLPAPTVVPGSVTQNLAALALSGSIPAITVVPGAVIVNLSALSAAATLPNASASTTAGGVTVNLAALSATGSLPLPTVQVGPVTIPLAALSVAATLAAAIAGEAPQVTPTVVLTLEDVPVAILTLESVPAAAISLESVPAATVSTETIAAATLALEDVPEVALALD